MSVARQYFHFRSMVGQLSHGCHEALLGNLESDSESSRFGDARTLLVLFLIDIFAITENIIGVI